VNYSKAVASHHLAPLGMGVMLRPGAMVFLHMAQDSYGPSYSNLDEQIPAAGVQCSRHKTGRNGKSWKAVGPRDLESEVDSDRF
jgi:hypothetical protein